MWGQIIIIHNIKLLSSLSDVCIYVFSNKLFHKPAQSPSIQTVCSPSPPLTDVQPKRACPLCLHSAVTGSSSVRLSSVSSLRRLFKDLSVMNSPVWPPLRIFLHHIHYETWPPLLLTTSLLGISPFIYWLIHHPVELQPQPEEQSLHPGVCGRRPAGLLKIQELPRPLRNQINLLYTFCSNVVKEQLRLPVSHVGLKNKDSESNECFNLKWGDICSLTCFWAYKRSFNLFKYKNKRSTLHRAFFLSNARRWEAAGCSIKAQSTPPPPPQPTNISLPTNKQAERMGSVWQRGDGGRERKWSFVRGAFRGFLLPRRGREEFAFSKLLRSLRLTRSPTARSRSHAPADWLVLLRPRRSEANRAKRK